MADAKGVGRELEKLIERTMRRLELRAYQALTSATPVKTGFARAGWTVGTGSAPSPGLIERPQDEVVAKAQAQAVFTKVRAVVNALAAGYTLKMGPIFFVNGVLYLPFLDAGSSAQAPKRFIERAIRKAVRVTQAEVR